MTEELINFLRICLDEEAAIADDCTGPDWQVDPGDGVNALHIARHDPTRVLAEIEAKRRTLIRCQEELMAGMPRLTHFIQQTLREMALPYATHPKFPVALAS
ncbi:DUF6221 family protein [Streptomyces sp. NPDC051555]|uniref:DUF6221 family protein n=1 Tax=Streptomyces sp. NPDC051555 TaxID=3365657 RepID=UPI00378D2335